MPDPVSSRGQERVAAWQPPDLRTVAAPGSPERRAAGPTREEAAYALGWDEGRADLIEAGVREQDAAASACQAAAAAMRQAVDAMQARFAAAVNLLSVGIAWHLVEREFAADPTLLEQLVARALVLAPLTGAVTVRLHPEDLEALQALPGGLQGIGPALEISWVADPAIHRAGCLLEGPATVVDGRIDRAILDVHERLSHD